VINKMNILKKSLVGGLAISFMIVFAINATAADPMKKGDIVGRETTVPNAGPMKGYIGLYDITDKGGIVIQVNGSYNVWTGVPQPALIVSESLDKFKSQTTYWGAKYVGRGTDDLLSVVTAAREQMNNYPQGDYQSSSVAIPGQIVKRYKRVFYNNWVLLDNYVVKPKFRTDTFVNWAHTVGNNQSLVPTLKQSILLGELSQTYTYEQYVYLNAVLIPKDVFNSSTLKSRGVFYGNSCGSGSVNTHMTGCTQ